MLLNRVEKALMNNPVRAALQRRFEAPRLLKMGGPVPANAKVLEIGCGRGVGTELLIELFGASHVDAFDLDPDMVALAKKRLTKHDDRVRLWTGDATSIDAPDAQYHAVFDFGILHHVPNWRQALAEIQRVLVPGGRLYAEEVLDRCVLHPVWRRLLDHPTEDRFDHNGFLESLAEASLKPLTNRQLGTWFGWYVAEKPKDRSG